MRNQASLRIAPAPAALIFPYVFVVTILPGRASKVCIPTTSPLATALAIAASSFLRRSESKPTDSGPAADARDAEDFDEAWFDELLCCAANPFEKGRVATHRHAQTASRKAAIREVQRMRYIDFSFTEI